MTTSERRETATYLLNHGFLIKDEDSMRKMYWDVVNHEEEFQTVFREIGYALVINAGTNVIQLVNNYNEGRVAFTKFESIVLLILRLLFVEKRERLSTNADKVYATIAEIKQEYDKLNLSRLLARSFDTRKFEEALRKYKQFNLATAIGRIDSMDSKIQIFPSVMMGIPDAAISKQYEEIRNRLAQYEGAQEDETNYDQSNSDEADQLA